VAGAEEAGAAARAVAAARATASVAAVSEYERVDRSHREPTVEDVRQLMGASTPHFALHLRNRIRALVERLPEGHPARREGEREMSRLDDVAFGAEQRGAAPDDLRGLPSERIRGRA